MIFSCIPHVEGPWMFTCYFWKWVRACVRACGKFFFTENFLSVEKHRFGIERQDMWEILDWIPLIHFNFYYIQTKMEMVTILYIRNYSKVCHRLKGGGRSSKKLQSVTRGRGSSKRVMSPLQKNIVSTIAFLFNVAFHADNKVWVENMNNLANMRSKMSANYQLKVCHYLGGDKGGRGVKNRW